MSCEKQHRLLISVTTSISVQMKNQPKWNFKTSKLLDSFFFLVKDLISSISSIFLTSKINDESRSPKQWRFNSILIDLRYEGFLFFGTILNTFVISVSLHFIIPPITISNDEYIFT